MRELDLENVTLAVGSHKPDHTFCVMEAVAFVAGENWSDAPVCACRVISSFLRICNDNMDIYTRQKLKQFILPLCSSKSTLAVEIKRARYLADWCQQFADADADADAAAAADADAYAAAAYAYVDAYAAAAAAADADAYAAAAYADAARAADAYAAAAYAAVYAAYAARAAARAAAAAYAAVIWDKAIEAIRVCLEIKE